MLETMAGVSLYLQTTDEAALHGHYESPEEQYVTRVLPDKIYRARSITDVSR